MSGNQMYLTCKANFRFFLFITQILFLLYFASAQINYVYDVYDSVYRFIIEKLCSGMYNDKIVYISHI